MIYYRFETSGIQKGTIPSSKREPVRMNPTGRKTYKDISLYNVFSINDFILLHNTHSKTT